MADPDEMGRALLGWYDRHARALPWRVPPGSPARADPYRVWLSEVMLQQTTVAAAAPYFARFTARWPTVEALAAAEDAEVMGLWAGLGYYARARNLLACARAVAARGGFPETEAGLRALPGVGDYTAAAVASIAWGERAVVVDGNVERVVARLWDIGTPLPAARRAIREGADALTPPGAPLGRPGDHAQAMMDLGATICTPRRPACVICPVAWACLARERGTQGERPVKAAKRAVPERAGVAWVGRRADGAWLVETRDARRMLGGTLGFPTTAWDRPGAPEEGEPAPGPWAVLPTPARHGFSHFGLTLEVRAAVLPLGANPERGHFVAGLDPGALPTLMRRVLEVALAAPPLGPAQATEGAQD